MRLEDLISWFQSELVYYDATLWDKSIEQRILRELGTKPKKECIFSKDRVDLDLLNGTAYKSKSKHDWSAEIWRGVKTTAFASIHWDYWRRHTSTRMATCIIFHFVLQLLQVICFLLLDPKNIKVTAADVFVPLAMGLGLGILHAQITAYDPQRRTRPFSSRPMPACTFAPETAIVVESPPSPEHPTAIPKVSSSTVAPHMQSNLSNRVSTSSRACLPSENVETPINNKISLSNHILEGASNQWGDLRRRSCRLSDGDQSEMIYKNDKSARQKSSFSLMEGSECSGKISEGLTPTRYRRRALSLKLVSRGLHRPVYCSLRADNDSHSQVKTLFGCKPSSGAGNDADVESDQEVYEGELQSCLRKRSASLSPDFCLSVPTLPAAVAPLEKIKSFKEAKMRGVTDPEVFANYQLQQFSSGSGIKGQQLSPPLVVSKWKNRPSRMFEAISRNDDETDAESNGEEAEIFDEHGDAAASNELNSNSNDDHVSLIKLHGEDRSNALLLTPSNEVSDNPDEEGRPKSSEGEREAQEEEDELEASDTFTTRSRQRAKFLKLFLERAVHHRQQRGGQQASRLPTGSANLHGEVHGQSFTDNVAAPDSVPYRLLPSTASVAPKVTVSTNPPATCRGGPSAVQKRSVTRTKLVKFRKKNPSVDLMTHPPSETEYDRMNSDVRSEYDSSSASEDEQSALRERASRLSASARSSPPSESIAIPSSTHHHCQQKQCQLQVRTSGLDDAVVGCGGGGGSGVTNTFPGIVEAKPQVSPAQDPDGGGDSVDDDDVGPFALWYFHTLQGFSDSSCVPRETVCCYVWEGKKMEKHNFTLLDIGWRIIQAVERQTVSMFYPRLSCIVALLLAVLPLFFHAWYQQPSSPSCISPSPTSMNTRPSSEAEVLRSELGVPRNALETPGILIVFVFHWVADVVTHVFVFSDSLASETSWPNFINLDNLVITLGILLRLNIYIVIFFLLSVAERSFQQRLLYAKHFYALTSSHRARKCRIPHLRLNKVAHVKCWLTLRSYLKKRGPQRSIECIITAAFYLAFAFGLFFCARFLISSPSRRGGVFSSLAVWDILAYTAALSLFLLRFLTLGTKITKKFRNVSILITEQMNINLCMNRKPHKKEELSTTNQVLKLAENLLKEVDGPYRICGWAVNPLIYNVFKLVLLSCFSAFISEVLGFKLKLYKLKLNPANW